MDDRLKELIAIGASVTANCHPCIKYHLAKARKMGVDEADIRQAVEVGKMVRKGAAGEMDKLLSKLVEEAADDEGCGCGGEEEEAPADATALSLADDATCVDVPLPERIDGTRRLDCTGLWGGIEDLDEEISSVGVAASLFSSSCDGGKGGDIYFFGACKGDKLTRVAVADVVGHGQAVTDVSEYMYDALKAHVCDPDSGTILSEVNRLAAAHGLKAMTTAAVVAYSAVEEAFLCAYAGHPPALLKRANEKTWSADDPGDGAGLPLAVAVDADYGLQTIPAGPGDRLFVYTDGVTEAPNAERELFGDERLKEVLDANADAPLAELKSAVLQALNRHTADGLTHDDVTLIAMEVR